MTGMTVIEVEGLTKVFGETIAIEDLHFQVEKGEIFGYLGPNGAGKTVTLRTLLGFLKPTKGTATVLGADIQDEDAMIEIKQDIGYLPEKLGFDENVTGQTFLDYQARLKGDQRLDEMLELFKPPLSRRIRELSSGNRQMLGIIQTFMHDPDLVIMDEPTRGLDPLMQERFNSFIKNERDSGVTIIFSSHILPEVRRVCNRVGIIREGKIVALETMQSLLQKGVKKVRINAEKPIGPDELDIDGITDFEIVGEDVNFMFRGDYNNLLECLSHYSLIDMVVEEPPLSDIFTHFYGDDDE